MADPVPLSNIPRPQLFEEYDSEAMEHSFQAVELDLAEKFDRRSDLILDPGKELVLTADDSSAMYGIGIDSDGYLRVLDYSDGTIGTFSVAWEQVDGASQEITNLTAYVDAADATLQGSVTTNAASIVVNGNAISGIETEITAARDGEASLSAKFTSVEGAFASADTAIASDVTALTARVTTNEGDITAAEADIVTNATAIATETSARASAITTLTASVYDEAQRPNLIASEYQLFGELEDLPFYIRRGSKVGTSVDNPFLNRDAQKFESDGTDPFLSVSLTAASGTTNIVAPPGRYAYKISLRCQTADVSSVQVRLRDSSNTLIASGSGHTPTGAQQLIEGVLDLSSETVSDYFLDLHVTLTGSVASVDFYPFRAQFEAIPDDATGPGDWSAGATVASVVETKEAIADIEGNLTARYAIAVDGGGNGAFFSLEDGTAIGSTISLSASEIILDGDVLTTGTVARTALSSAERDALGAEGIAANFYQQSSDPGSVPDGSFWADTNNGELNARISSAWEKIADISGNLSGATVSNSTPSGNAPSANASATSDSTTVTATGGDGTYTYSWAKVQGDAITANSASAATTTFSGTPGQGNTITAVLRCTVTETSTGNKAQIDVYVTLIDLNP